MRWKSRFTAWSVIWLTMAALCVAGGAGAMEAGLSATQGRVACRYDGDGPSLEGIKILRDSMAGSAKDGKAEGAVTAWAQVSNTELTAKELGSTLEVDALWIDGDSRQIWSWNVIRGSLPVFGTARVCALDGKSARKLFGSSDIVGQQVEIDGVSYTVACVFELPEGLTAWGADPGNGLALCPAAALAEPAPFQALDFDVIPQDAQTPKEWVEAWLNESRTPQPIWMDALWQQHRLLALAAQCAPTVLLFSILWTLGKAGLGLLRSTAREARVCWSDRSLPVERGWRIWAFGLAFAGALGVLAAWAVSLAQISLDVPPDYLPTRWSDLSFWGTLARESAQEQAARQMLGALRPDMLRARLYDLSLGFSLASIPILGLARHHLRQSASSRPSWLRITGIFLCGAISLPLALWCVRALGLPAALPKGWFPLTMVFIAVAQLAEGYPPAKLLTTYISQNQKEVSL